MASKDVSTITELVEFLRESGDNLTSEDRLELTREFLAKSDLGASKEENQNIFTNVIVKFQERINQAVYNAMWRIWLFLGG